MRKQLITAGGRENGRERESEVGRLVLRRMPIDAAASLHSREDNREREGGREGEGKIYTHRVEQTVSAGLNLKV